MSEIVPSVMSATPVQFPFAGRSIIPAVDRRPAKRQDPSLAAAPTTTTDPSNLALVTPPLQRGAQLYREGTQARRTPQPAPALSQFARTPSTASRTTASLRSATFRPGDYITELTVAWGSWIDDDYRIDIGGITIYDPRQNVGISNGPQYQQNPHPTITHRPPIIPLPTAIEIYITDANPLGPGNWSYRNAPHTLTIATRDGWVLTASGGRIETFSSPTFADGPAIAHYLTSITKVFQ